MSNYTNLNSNTDYWSNQNFLMNPYQVNKDGYSASTDSNVKDSTLSPSSYDDSYNQRLPNSNSSIMDNNPNNGNMIKNMGQLHTQGLDSTYSGKNLNYSENHLQNQNAGYLNKEIDSITNGFMKMNTNANFNEISNPTSSYNYIAQPQLQAMQPLPPQQQQQQQQQSQQQQQQQQADIHSVPHLSAGDVNLSSLDSNEILLDSGFDKGGQRKFSWNSNPGNHLSISSSISDYASAVSAVANSSSGKLASKRDNYSSSDIYGASYSQYKVPEEKESASSRKHIENDSWDLDFINKNEEALENITKEELITYLFVKTTIIAKLKKDLEEKDSRSKAKQYDAESPDYSIFSTDSIVDNNGVSDLSEKGGFPSSASAKKNISFEIPKTHEELYIRLNEKLRSTQEELEETNLRLESVLTAIALNPTQSIISSGRYDEEEVAHRIVTKLQLLTEENDEMAKMLSYGKSKEKDIEIGLLRKQNIELKDKIAKLESKVINLKK